MADPSRKKGKSLPVGAVEKVVEFFQSDEYSRVCPGKKDYVSMTVDGECKQMQKRLLLANLKELHIEFTIYNTVQYSLPVTSRGMHSMCVCEHHQNIKLLMPAIPQHTEYTDLLKKIVCSINS